ncbi:MAG: hypothetical protein WCG66_06730 [bacterium]
MKSIATPLLAALVMMALHTSCERHPASETIPGYADKLQKKDEESLKKATHSEPADSQAPSYFPPKN